MDSATASNLIAGGALLLSAAAFARGELAVRRGAIQAKEADSAAKEATHAAKRSAAALEKMAEQWADNLSRQEKRDQRQWHGRPGGGTSSAEPRSGPWMGPAPHSDAPEPVVHWTVDRIKGGQHLLRNLGRATAYDVEFRGDNTVRFDAPSQARNLRMGEAVEFLAIGSMQTGTPELTVSWRDTPNGDRKEWRRPLP